MEIKELMLKKTEIFRQEIRRRVVSGVIEEKRAIMTQENDTMV